MFGGIAYYVAVIVFRFTLLEHILTPYSLEHRMHRLSFILVVVEPLAKQINIVLLNTHTGLTLTDVFKQRGCSNPNTFLRFIVECHDTKYKIRFVICNIVIHIGNQNGLEL